MSGNSRGGQVVISSTQASRGSSYGQLVRSTQLKLLFVPSLSITYQGLSVGHIAAEVSEMKDLVLFLVGFTYLRT